MSTPQEKTAVILFNLGGPDGSEAVKPFLFNLFRDPAIIMVPNPLRWIIAKLITRQRVPKAQEIYGKIGGKSPIVEQTLAQAETLEHELNSDGEKHYKCFISMRYWHPFSGQVVEEVKSYGADKIVLLPLYPQYSLTTTGSSLIDWVKSSKKAGLDLPYRVIKEYPVHPSFIGAHVALVENVLKVLERPEDYRILFSAHGLPEKVIEAGDPYQTQVEETCEAIMADLDHEDYVVCYQSRVGPLEWIGPSTDEELERVGKDGKSVIIVPVAFVSEHLETLVELDMEYNAMAQQYGVKDYIRVKTLGCHEKFIEGLVDMVKNS